MPEHITVNKIGVAGGIAPLDSGCKVPAENLPAGSGAAWGGITGTLAAQTDLQTVLDGKASIGSIGSSGIGIPGIDGEDGLEGWPGASGRNGIDGVAGDPGTPGSPGATGSQGLMGIPGQDGENGGDNWPVPVSGLLKDSSFSGLGKITVGSTTPPNPSIGDLWIDTT